MVAAPSRLRSSRLLPGDQLRLNFLKGGYKNRADDIGEYCRVIEGVTRSVDNVLVFDKLGSPSPGLRILWEATWRIMGT